jgi:hypothetical protein
MARIKVVEAENAEGKVKAVYDQLQSVFGKVPGVMKALSPWPDVLELYATRVVGLFSDINRWVDALGFCYEDD